MPPFAREFASSVKFIVFLARIDYIPIRMSFLLQSLPTLFQLSGGARTQRGKVSLGQLDSFRFIVV